MEALCAPKSALARIACRFAPLFLLPLSLFLLLLQFGILVVQTLNESQFKHRAICASCWRNQEFSVHSGHRSNAFSASISSSGQSELPLFSGFAGMGVTIQETGSTFTASAAAPAVAVVAPASTPAPTSIRQQMHNAIHDGVHGSVAAARAAVSSSPVGTHSPSAKSAAPKLSPSASHPEDGPVG